MDGELKPKVIQRVPFPRRLYQLTHLYSEDSLGGSCWLHRFNGVFARSSGTLEAVASVHEVDDLTLLTDAMSLDRCESHTGILVQHGVEGQQLVALGGAVIGLGIFRVAL